MSRPEPAPILLRLASRWFSRAKSRLCPACVPETNSYGRPFLPTRQRTAFASAKHETILDQLLAVVLTNVNGCRPAFCRPAARLRNPIRLSPQPNASLPHRPPCVACNPWPRTPWVNDSNWCTALARHKGLHGWRALRGSPPGAALRSLAYLPAAHSGVRPRGGADAMLRTEASQTVAALAREGGGKSGLHRAGCRVTPGRYKSFARAEDEGEEQGHRDESLRCQSRGG